MNFFIFNLFSEFYKILVLMQKVQHSELSYRFNIQLTFCLIKTILNSALYIYLILKFERKNHFVDNQFFVWQQENNFDSVPKFKNILGAVRAFVSSNNDFFLVLRLQVLFWFEALIYVCRFRGALVSERRSGTFLFYFLRKKKNTFYIIFFLT